MTNNTQIESVLDELLKNKLTKTEAKALLEKENIQGADAEIELHYASAKAIQRYMILKQVQDVHSAFIKASTKAGTIIPAAKKAPKVIPIKPVKWLMGIAASLFVFAAAWFTYQYSTTNSSKLYSEMYQPYNVNTDRGIGDIAKHNMVKEFQAGDYPAVIKTYESLTTSNSREKFLAGYAYHETANFNRAIELLRQLLISNRETKQRLYNDEAEFYLGLSFLKIKDAASAKTIFETIRKNPDHTFYERVSKWTMTRLNWLK